MQNSSTAPIIVLGADGYLGWPLSLRLARSNPDKKIIAVDNQLRRRLVGEVGGCSLFPILDPAQRTEHAAKIYGVTNLQYMDMDVNSEALNVLIRESQPQAVYHLAQQCSAPYSMRGCAEAIFTMNNNEGGNMRLLWAVKEHVPECHIIKLGSFGEYAKSGIQVCEGYFEPEYRGKRAGRPIPYPREADDFYHASKINDTNYISIACRKWGLKITDIMQSTVFGGWTSDIEGRSGLYTRFDYDETFGTVANRFMVQALAGRPLSVYGSGNQRTGLMGLNDCIESMATLWSLHPPHGTHKVINHLTEESYSINELALTIQEIAAREGLKVEIQHGVHDPRGEDVPVKLDYCIDRVHVSRNLIPTTLQEVVSKTFKMLLPYREQINMDCLSPVTIWGTTPQNVDLSASSPEVEEVPALANETEWEIFRSRHFPNQAVNLNPGTLGTPSQDVLESMRMFDSTDTLACPLEQYQLGQSHMQAAAKTANSLWPSAGHNVHVAPSATRCANLLALALARVSARRKRPLRVLTTAHEHIGGIGALRKMPEFTLIYLTEYEMKDLKAFELRVKESKPDVGFFSHVTYDKGEVLPVSDWAALMKRASPQTMVLVDISQSLGLLPPPFAKTDVLFSSGHKWLFGPRGSGLLWTTQAFRNEVQALYWAGDCENVTDEESGFVLTGGMDFSVFAGLDTALKLHGKTGEPNVRERGIYLKKFFRSGLQMVLEKHAISAEYNDAAEELGILSVAFDDFDPYPLYMALNKAKIHCKCIKDTLKLNDQESKPRQILRFGFPYYETKLRMENALMKLDQYLGQNATERLERSAPGYVPAANPPVEDILFG